MNQFRATFDRLPEDAKDEVFDLLYRLLASRAAPGLMGDLARQARAEDIAEVFSRHGREVEQYT
jgi:hypothetical protein